MFDERGGQRAAEALLQSSPRFSQDPHRPLYAAHAVWAHQVFSGAYSREVVASVARWLARGARVADDFPEPAMTAEPSGRRPYDLRAVAELSTVIGDGSPEVARQFAVELLLRGYPLDTLWDAIILSAAEGACTAPVHTNADVHTLTMSTAVRFASETAQRPAELTLRVLDWAARTRAADPSPALRLAEMASGIGGGLDDLGGFGYAPGSLEALLETPVQRRVDRLAAALEWLSDHDSAPVLVACRRAYLHRVHNPHHLKVMHALDRAAALMHPGWTDVLVAAALALLPDDSPWPQYDHARQLAATLVDESGCLARLP